MRTLVLAAVVAVTVVAHVPAQCPDYSHGTASAGIGKFNGGEEARLVYVDCLSEIAFIDAKFGKPGQTTPLDGLPLTLSIFDDPNDDMNPADAVPVAVIPVPGGVTGGNTGVWQHYDLFAIAGITVPTTGGMFVGVGVAYGPGAAPGSIEFNNNAYPHTQWLASDQGGTLDYAVMSNNQLLDVSTGPGFPPGTWIIRVEGGAGYRAFGAGCAGSNGTPTLTGVSAAPPVLGQSALLTVSNLPIPATPTVIALGFDRLATPLDLGAIGMTGCTFDIDLLLTTPLVSSAGTSGWSAMVPMDTSVAGRSVFAQVATLDAPANPFGITTSNAVQVILGR